ncbi:MAG: hypothetical protein KI790_07560 [Cyclobacteriaceae bacterium]|nr:hypothetical protein [Cyclobacteriaceae bacterium HetDA_MAG_MS6]
MIGIRTTFTIVFGLLLFCSEAQEHHFFNPFGHQLNTNESGVVLDGYDVVSYFRQERPVMGKEQYSSVYQQSLFYFSCKSNKRRFDKNPDQYIPQFGGWCALGVCFGLIDDKWPSGQYKVDPENYLLMDEKLYLFYPEKEFPAKSKWLENPDVFITEATNVWDSLITATR